jgi:hypothetical protein
MARSGRDLPRRKAVDRATAGSTILFGWPAFQLMGEGGCRQFEIVCPRGRFFMAYDNGSRDSAPSRDIDVSAGP